MSLDIYQKIEIPDGEAHGAKIINFEITKAEVIIALIRMRQRTHMYDYPPRVGKHVKLVVDGETMMSNTEMEKASNLEFVHKAAGDVLVAGLGIGLIIKPLLRKPEVTSVVVIEKSAGVIILVAPHVAHPKVSVIQADIFTWKTKQKFDTIYFDIWPFINVENLDEMTKLNRKFSRSLKPGGWRGAWMQEPLRYEKARDR